MSKIVADVIDKFVADIQSIVDNHYSSNLRPIIVAEETPKYFKIWEYRQRGNDTTPKKDRIYGFVLKQNGDILKAANTKVPAKHARGNVFSDNPTIYCGPYGIAYMDDIKRAQKETAKA